MRRVCEVLACVGAAVACAGAAHGQVAYSVQFLPGLVPGGEVYVNVITQAGVAAGSAWDGDKYLPVRWVGGTPTPLDVGAFAAGFYRVNGHSGDALVGEMLIQEPTQGWYAFQWDPVNGFQSIITAAGGGQESYASGINSAGAVSGGTGLRAIRWTASGGATIIQFPNTPAVPDYGGASAINDGGVVVGHAGHAAGPMPNDGLQAFRWTEAAGIERLEINLGGSIAIANDINASGDIVGIANIVDFPELGPDKAWLWSNGVVTVLGSPTDPISSFATAINDGGEVLGFDGEPIGIGIPDLDHWVWINGAKVFLADVTALPSGWRIEQVHDMNNDGAIAATLFNESLFERRPALLVRDGGCYPDCNASGSLTVADFTCFQTRFVAGEPYADCNASGTLTVADFTCFQTRFVAGCP